MTRKSSKKALLMSVLSLLLCCAMLVGSTFAWFTDTAKTGMNKIVAGNLDIELKYVDKEFTTEGLNTGYSGESWQNADDKTNLFEHKEEGTVKDFLWEPGAMLISKPFKLTNEGNLALQYQLTADIVKETKTSDKHSLAEVIKMTVVTEKELKEGITSSDITTTDNQQNHEALWKNLTKESGGNPVGGYSSSSFIYPQGTDTGKAGGYPVHETDPMFVVLYWAPGTNDNDYNLNNEKKDELGEDGPLSIEFGLNVFATQTPFEKDSFGDKYDENAMAQHEVHEAVEAGIASANESLAALLEKDNALTVGELTYDKTSGHYQSTLTFGAGMLSGDGRSVDATTLMNAYGFMASMVTEAVNAQKENIASITIGGQKVDRKGADNTYDENDMKTALLAWFADAASDAEPGKEGKLDALSELTCSVSVEDVGGTSVIYDLIFNMDALKSVLSGN